MDIDEGDRVIRVDSVVNDFVLAGSCDLIMSSRRYPMDTLRTQSAKTVQTTTRKVDMRLECRQVAIEVRSDGLGDFWRLGQLRMNVGQAGKR
jgi:hypothetical protein